MVVLHKQNRGFQSGPVKSCDKIYFCTDIGGHSLSYMNPDIQFFAHLGRTSRIRTVRAGRGAVEFVQKTDGYVLIVISDKDVRLQ